MKIRTIQIPLFCLIFLTGVVASAQNNSNVPSDPEGVTKELGMLRQSVQSLDATLSDIGNKLLSTPAKNKDAAADTQSRISTSFAILAQAEQRAEGLRRQLLDLIEKETLYRSRLTQLEEDLRPESLERAMSTYGTTRTAEIRDARRRVLEAERRGFQNLLTLTIESRGRLESEVRQADTLVERLRQRVNPLLEK